MTNFIFYCDEFLVLDKKRRESCDHLEYYIAQSPPVTCKTYVCTFLEYLWRQVLRSSGYRISLLYEISSATEAEIDESDEPFFIDENIFWFETV